MADELGTRFLVRTCVDRLAGDGNHTIADEMGEVRVRGLHRVEFRDERGQPCQATLEIRYRRIRVLPPIGKQKLYPPLELTVLHAQERQAPASRAPLQWKLITNLPVRSKAQAIEKIDWYAMRWKIETFHKILKSGCRAEDSRLRTAERLTNARLRLAFWMAGQVAVRLRENAFKDKYDRYIRSDPGNSDLRRKALTAVAAKMARVAYSIINVNAGLELTHFRRNRRSETDPPRHSEN